MTEPLDSYTEPTADQMQAMWASATISIDTNVLLQLFSQSPKSADEQLSALESLGSRIWIPHQVVHEYMLNEGTHARAAIEATERYVSAFQELDNSLKQRAAKILLHHDSIKASREKVGQLSAELSTQLSSAIEHAKDYVETLKARIRSIITTYAGQRPTKATLQAYADQAQQRLKLQLPPGNRDAKKAGFTRWFGDILIWLELLDHACSEKTPVIFCTNDQKDDWWFQDVDLAGTEVWLPQPHLVEEFREDTGRQFFMLRSGQFFEHLAKYRLANPPEEATVAELDDAFRQSHVQATERILGLGDTGSEQRFVDIDKTSAAFDHVLNRSVAERNQTRRLIEDITGTTPAALEQFINRNVAERDQMQRFIQSMSGTTPAIIDQFIKRSAAERDQMQRFIETMTGTKPATIDQFIKTGVAGGDLMQRFIETMTGKTPAEPEQFIKRSAKQQGKAQRPIEGAPDNPPPGKPLRSSASRSQPAKKARRNPTVPNQNNEIG